MPGAGPAKRFETRYAICICVTARQRICLLIFWERDLFTNVRSSIRIPALLQILQSPIHRSLIMPRGSKEKYTDKQKRQAEHIEEGYETRGADKKEAKRRAWATVNTMTG